MSAKKTKKIDINYENKKCLLCKKSHVVSVLFDMQSIDQFLMCHSCIVDFRRVTEHIK